ncbi:hypothetical protein [Iocasia frigidifontis]|nr:hypothetical protein [Iocasia fonsfrigidae]
MKNYIVNNLFGGVNMHNLVILAIFFAGLGVFFVGILYIKK